MRRSDIIKNIIRSNSYNTFELFKLKRKIFTFLNPVSYLSIRERPELISKVDGIFADGQFLVNLIRFRYRISIQRRSFDMTSMAKELFSYCNENEKSIYLIGNTNEIINNSVKFIHAKYPNIKIIGYRNGYFDNNKEINSHINLVVNLKPDFVIIGMGVIKQEEYLIKLKDAGFDGIGFSCGGFFNQIFNKEMNYYPNWIDKLNIRFLYRFIKEPHTRRRYLHAMLNFPVKFFFDTF